MNVLELFKSVTTFVFDVDGVLTDGTLIVLPDGVMARRMNIKDGYALQFAIKRGYRVVIISGGISAEVEQRLKKLGISDVHMGVEDKHACLTAYMEKHNLLREEVLYIGDDIPDYQVMQLAGLACCPADAVTEIKSIAEYISPFNGGEGCGRDVIEKTLRLRGDWGIDTHIQSR